MHISDELLRIFPKYFTVNKELHSLECEAKEIGKTIVSSIFINPLQFGVNEDFDSYPRTLENDLIQLESAGSHFVFHPSKEILEGIKASERDVKTIARRVENLLSYGKNHPYGEYASEASVNKIKISDIEELYLERFYPQNTYVIIVGDINFNIAKNLSRVPPPCVVG